MTVTVTTLDKEVEMCAQIINPEGLVKPRGYSHGTVAEGRFVFVAGQVGVDAKGRPVGDDFESQFDRSLAGVVEVVRAAGGRPENIVKMSIFVKDIDQFRSAKIGPVYASHLGKHFPAMTALEVSGFMDDRYLVEIEAMAQVG